jgi:hypothetical protein
MIPPIVKGGQGRSDADIYQETATLTVFLLAIVILLALLGVMSWLTGGAL